MTWYDLIEDYLFQYQTYKQVTFPYIQVQNIYLQRVLDDIQRPHLVGGRYQAP